MLPPRHPYDEDAFDVMFCAAQYWMSFFATLRMTMLWESRSSDGLGVAAGALRVGSSHSRESYGKNPYAFTGLSFATFTGAFCAGNTVIGTAAHAEISRANFMYRKKLYGE